ncbi:MAG: citrate transporter [Rhodospirillaceae bacterium BRH_c57]|nr:MAG: citrate transporter [Rhodospirillaceae bacterium BRH_c57]
MTFPQAAILLILAAAMALFIWGRWRHDIVAMLALLAAVAVGLVAPGAAFDGFGHPAVITVAAVLILSRGLFNSGAIDILARVALPTKAGPVRLIGGMALLAAFLSAFMNNVGALALMMPVVIQAAHRNNIPVGRLLMPVSFASILGGMSTLIGTPPNIIVSGFRAEVQGAPFGMFDFSPVGVTVAIGGVIFVSLIGWRLLPTPRGGKAADGEPFDIGRYFTEVRVRKGSSVVDKSLSEFEADLGDIGAQVVGLVRSDERILAPSGWRRIREQDILVLEAEPQALTEIVTTLNLELVADRTVDEDVLTSDAIELTEVAVRPGSSLVGRTVAEIRLRSRFGVNLLALSRQGSRSWKRLRDQRLEAGDVLLLQGGAERTADVITQFNCVPLVERTLKFPKRRETITATVLMAAAIAATVAGVPAQISFAGGAVAFVLSGLVPLRGLYESIDWSVIVLLGALLPLAGAMEASGAAALIAQGVIGTLSGGSPVIALTLIMIVSINLTDFMNNAATAAVMAPIAVVVAQQFGVNPDSFLIAVAVGSSSAFLTPIGHQNNTLILGPGGYRFADYWRMGLPLEILVVLIGVPVILVAWPF